MHGIQFMTDRKGRRTAVVIDLQKHKTLWEDIQDGLVVEARRKEPRYSLAQVEAELKKSRKLRA